MEIEKTRVSVDTLGTRIDELTNRLSSILNKPEEESHLSHETDVPEKSIVRLADDIRSINNNVAIQSGRLETILNLLEI